jgi:hypothetical protein
MHALPMRARGARPAPGLLALLAGLGLACRAHAAPSAAQPLATALDPVAAVETWVRLKGDADGAVTFEWVTGTAHALPADAPGRPLFRIESVTVRQFRRSGPAIYVEQSYSCRLYRALEGDAYVRSFLNPLTQREVALEPRCSTGPRLRHAPQAVELLDPLPLHSTALGVPPQLQRLASGATTTYTRHAHTEFEATAGGVPRRESSIDTYTVPSVLDTEPRPSSLDAAYQWTSVAPWMRGLGLDAIPGRMLWVVHGRKLGRVEELPAELRAEIARLDPAALAHRFHWPTAP